MCNGLGEASVHGEGAAAYGLARRCVLSPAQVSLGVVECLLGSDFPFVPLFLAQEQLPSTPRLQFPPFIMLGIQPEPSFWAGRRFSLVPTPNLVQSFSRSGTK